MLSDRVAIVGSRNHPNLDMVREYVRTLDPYCHVISGGARGVDMVAADEARNHLRFIDTVRVYGPSAGRNALGWPRSRLKVEPDGSSHMVQDVDWSRRDQYFIRNTLIAVQCDRMVVFPDGSKGGCWDAARQAVRFKRPCELRYADGRVVPYTGGKR